MREVVVMLSIMDVALKESLHWNNPDHAQDMSLAVRFPCAGGDMAIGGSRSPQRDCR